MTLPNCAEDLLIERAAQGCEDAIREIIDHYSGRLLSFLSQRGNRDQSEDLLQETMIAALDGLKSFDRSRSFSAWIFGIARNKANELHRKIVRINELHGRVSASELDSIMPSETIEQTEQTGLFWAEARQLLAENQFSCMWLRYQEELGLSEISEALGKSVANIKVILFRARQILLNSPVILEQARVFRSPKSKASILS